MVERIQDVSLPQKSSLEEPALLSHSHVLILLMVWIGLRPYTWRCPQYGPLLSFALSSPATRLVIHTHTWSAAPENHYSGEM